ncbi:Ig-like domain-containing protein [Flavobacterium urocaniciphilum]|uniref:Gliding motility-associated C-terminal domain-containing protein n=1 Tax=Flavobacterium urocaniciphilum TaxID=1299341 RepID=A0A1H9CPQ3_9FLAO|nr:gliding motility-associated C-terminal domain-containing protein [Flavobacterium urocaniciphilum]SEQ03149.1 gliding motility-associated C-terminal domain-containing protein [Flavobacterium urocaniciphilum]
MKSKSTFKEKLTRVFCFSVLFLVFCKTEVSAQVNFVNANVLVSSSHATNAGNAAVFDNTFATLNSYGGVAIGIGAYNGAIELEFPTTLPAGKTSYVKIDFDQDVLNALVGGGLGGELADLLGTVVLGNHYFTIAAKNNNTSVSVFSSQNNFTSDAGKLIRDAAGNYYFAITPNQSYNRIEIVDHTDALLVGTSNSMKVYNAFYTEGTNSCDIAFATSFDGSGGTLDLIGLGNAGVTNPQRAIDTDVNSYSNISLGLLAVAGTINQTIYFSSLSNPTDQFHLTLQLDNPSILNLGLADGIKIEALNGTTVVYTYDIGTILDLDLIGLLSNGQKATIPISPGQAFDRVRISISSLVQLNVVKGLRIYDIYRSPAAPTIALASQNISICGSQSVTLLANTSSDNELVWYDSSTSSSPIAVTAYNVGYTTPVLNSTTTYYVAAKKIGCPNLSSRVPITVTFISVPLASDITVSNTTMTASCSGIVVIEPSTIITNSTFNYYTDQNKTQEITTGFSGHPGISYVKDAGTGALTISGLNTTNTPITYYVAIEVNGVCENANGTLLPITVVSPVQTSLTVTPTLTNCTSVNLADAIVGFDTSGNTIYTFYDSSMNVISASAAAAIQTSGTYYIQAEVPNSCISAISSVNVTVNPSPTLNINPSSYTANVGDSVTLMATSNAPITWYDSNGNALASNIAGPFMNSGTYTFTAIANNGVCSRSGIATVIVNSPTDCFVNTTRVYADTQSSNSILTGGVINNANAIDENPQSHSTITSGIGALGVGTTWQTLEWNDAIPAGTPVSIKLGTEYSGLTLIGAISVVGTKRNGMGVPVDIGTIQPLSGSIVNLLPGDNCFEYTFVPSNLSGPQIYDGVRIIVGSTVSVSQNAKVYEAYYNKVITPFICNTGDVEDLFHGVFDLGIGVLTNTTNVVNPWNAVDNSDASYATLYNGVGALSAAELTVKFRTVSQPTDILKIFLEKPGSTLNVGALSGFTVQRYMGDTPVGNLLIADGSAASLELLNGGNDGAIFISSISSPPYDRVKIRLGGALNMLDFLRVHYVKREANIDIVGGVDDSIEVCQDATITLTSDICTTYNWYDAATGGNLITTGISYTLPANTTPGTYTYYIQPVRSGCEVLSRTPITIVVKPFSPISAISDIVVNADDDTTFCSSTGNVTLTAQLNTVPVMTNPIFYWYSFDGTNQTLIVGENTNVLQLTGLAPGTYTYYVGVSSNEFCRTALPDRTAITFTILPFSTSGDITANNAQICLGTIATLSPSSTFANPQYTWFFTNDVSQPITNGTISGVTYNILPNGTLSITGLTALNSPYTYYVAMSSDTSCQNIPGTLKSVTVQLIEIATPTTLDATPDFCASTNPTIASLQINESGIIWYDAPSNGTVLPLSTPLVNGVTYYAGITDPISGCSSASRLQVTPTIITIPTPTTLDATPDFCATANPTIASLQVNESGIIWYDAAIGGTVLPTSTVLQNGVSYFASITDIVSGCSSSTRLEIIPTIINVPTPTITDATPDVCSTSNATLASLIITPSSGIIWYDAAVGGNVLATSTVLVNGVSYFAGVTDSASGCSSATRLEVIPTVITVPLVTTTDATPDFCATTNPTIASLQVNETGVIWYDAPINGNVLPATTTLVSGVTYYASITDSASGCSSASRTAITPTIITVPMATTNDASQDFCGITNPTIANLQVNESNIVWYDALTNGNILSTTTPLVDGGIYYALQIDPVSGCTSATRLAITVNFLENNTATITENSSNNCILTNTTYTTQAGMSNYVWTLSTGAVIVSGGGVNDNFITVQWTQTGTNSVSVSYNDSNGCSLVNTANLDVTIGMCSNLSITKTVDNPTPFVDDNVVFTITVTSTGLGSYSNIVVSEPLPSGYAYVSSTTSAGTYNPISGIWNIPSLAANQSATLLITATVLMEGDYLNIAEIISADEDDPDDGDVAGVTTDPLCLIVYNEFTPNEDGSNDFFNIKCAEFFPNNKLEIYNRYGNLVYETKYYKNTWKGISNVNGTFNGSVLPTGTYYYIFETGESDNRIKTGWVFIMR